MKHILALITLSFFMVKSFATFCTSIPGDNCSNSDSRFTATLGQECIGFDYANFNCLDFFNSGTLPCGNSYRNYWVKIPAAPADSCWRYDYYISTNQSANWNAMILSNSSCSSPVIASSSPCTDPSVTPIHLTFHYKSSSDVFIVLSQDTTGGIGVLDSFFICQTITSTEGAPAHDSCEAAYQLTVGDGISLDGNISGAHRDSNFCASIDQITTCNEVSEDQYTIIDGVMCYLTNFTGNLDTSSIGYYACSPSVENTLWYYFVAPYTGRLKVSLLYNYCQDSTGMQLTVTDFVDCDSANVTAQHIMAQSDSGIACASRQDLTDIHFTIDVQKDSVYYVISDGYAGTLCDYYLMISSPAGNPIQNTALSFCDSGQVTANSGYDSYLWSTGDTTSFISVNSSGNYYLEALIDTIVYYDTVFVAINSTKTSVIDTIVCDQLLFNGNQLTASGVYFDTLIGVAGCDSIITLNLVINQSSMYNFSEASCTSYTFDDTTYFQSGTYTKMYVNQGGCDSLVTLNLTIHDTSSTIITDISCEPYNFNDTIYNQSGVYKTNYSSINGCDSTVTLDLTIYTINDSVTINGNILSAYDSSAVSYQWIDCDSGYAILGANSQFYTVFENGNYAVVIVDSLGCKDTSDCQSIIGLSVLDNQNAKAAVMPNPFDNKIRIEWSDDQNGILRILNSSGAQIRIESLQGKEMEVDTHDFAPGIYIVEIINEQNELQYSVQMVKE